MTDIFACPQTREGLTEYLEDALSSVKRQGMETHLRSCPACRGHLARIRMAGDASSFGERMPGTMKARLLRVFRGQDPN